MAMKEFFVGLIVGAVLALGTGWYFTVGRQRADVRHAQDVSAAKVQQAADSVEAKLKSWHLNTDEIKAEMEKTGKVVRQSVREWSGTAADVAGDARITGTIKAKLVADKEIGGWSIGVSTSDGVVTLSGTVANFEQIARAILIASETPGVRKTLSTIQVKK